jgi:subtilisin family serine protease
MNTRTATSSRKTSPVAKSTKQKTATRRKRVRPVLKSAPPKRNATPARITHKPAHQHASSRQTFVPGQLIVRCRVDVTEGLPDVRRASIASLHTFALPTATESPFKKLEEAGLIREVKPIFSRMTSGRSLSVAPTNVATAFAMSVRDSENEDLRGITLLRLARSTDLEKVEKDLANTPGIEYVHRVPRRWITARPKPNDPLFRKQWGLPAIGWLEADPLPDASAVKVGVLDTGVDITHRELENVVQAYVHDGASSQDIVGHGTHVSGIIAAETNNNVGMSGTSRCDLSVWKVFTDTPDPEDGEFYVDEVMYQRALNAARNAGMRVVNLSIGGGDPSETEKILFRRLIDAGVTVVAAMGNEFKEDNPIEFPGAYPGVIAVGAIGKTKRRASFSNTGAHISLVAPGIGIVSTLPMKASAARGADETRYASWDGTSMATPYVSAVAALVVAANPTFTPAQVRKRLISTATKLAAMGSETKTNEYGYGLLNLERAVS